LAYSNSDVIIPWAAAPPLPANKDEPAITSIPNKVAYNNGREKRKKGREDTLHVSQQQTHERNILPHTDLSLSLFPPLLNCNNNTEVRGKDLEYWGLWWSR